MLSSFGAGMATPLSIIIVNSAPERARTICDGLTDLPSASFTVVAPGHGLARRIAALNPDLVLIETDNTTRDEMDALTLASGPMASRSRSSSPIQRGNDEGGHGRLCR